MKKIDAVLVGDIHIRAKVPVCRTSEFLNDQKSKLRFIRRTFHEALKTNSNCRLLIAGDLFNNWNASAEEILIATILLRYRDVCICPPGNHDLGYHSSSTPSAYNVARRARWVQRLDTLKEAAYTSMGFNEDEPVIGLEHNDDDSMRRVLVAHKMVWTEGSKPMPTLDAKDNAQNFLKRWSDYDLIVTEDNHMRFVVHHNGRLLVNPGSMMRTRADQCDHIPAIYLWSAEDNSIKEVKIPMRLWEEVDAAFHTPGEVSVDAKKLCAFVKMVGNGKHVTLDFKRNLMRVIDSLDENAKEIKEMAKLLLGE